MSLEKYADFPAQVFIAGAGLLQEILWFAGLPTQCFTEQPVDLLPAFRIHRCAESEAIIAANGLLRHYSQGAGLTILASLRVLPQDRKSGNLDLRL